MLLDIDVNVPHFMTRRLHDRLYRLVPCVGDWTGRV